MFSEDILEKIKDNDPKLSIELIKILIEKSLNLKVKLKEISVSKIDFSKYKQEEIDYMMLYHQKELQLLESRKVLV